MIALNFPKYDLRITKKDDKFKVFDIIRAKFIILTPEEWVRQHMVHFLIEEKKFPKGLISVESGLKLNKMQKRTDILVHDREGMPLLIVECKSPQVQIKQEAFEQIARYNMTLKVPFLVVTNGLEHYACKIDHKAAAFSFLESIPDYDELK